MVKSEKDSNLLKNNDSNDNIEIKESSKKEVNLKEKTKKSLVLKAIGIIIPTLAIVLGVGVGLYFGKIYFATKYDPNAYDINKIEDKTYDEFYNDYQELLGSNNGSLENIDLSETGKIEPYKIVNFAYGKYIQNEFNYSVSYGTVKAMGTLTTIRNISIKNNNNFMTESIAKGSGIASSIATLAKRFYQKENGDVKVYIGKDIDENKACYNENQFDENIKNVTDLENKIGRNYSRPTAYIISSKTCLATSNIKLIDNYYLISLDLDPENSVVRYVKQMNYISNIDYPTFKSINIKFKLTRNLDLIENEVNENYIVNQFGMNIETNGYLKEIFHQNENIDILKLNENYDFKGDINNEN
mgnify:CR=1 FL=1